jgi:hypothetical protein
VIDERGTLQYWGSIDDHLDAVAFGIEDAHSYVQAALDSLKSGVEVSEPSVPAYGCHVKY